MSAARFGISVEGAQMYTTMQPCFGCAKEIVQAKISKVIYLHPWVPTNDDPLMAAAMREEYAKLMSRLDVVQLKDFDDPVAAWAVTSLRNKR